jgi:hypothetical protein
MAHLDMAGNQGVGLIAGMVYPLLATWEVDIIGTNIYVIGDYHFL